MKHSRVTRERAGATVLVSTAAVSAVGLVVHNFADLPGETVLHAESLYPVLLTTALVAIWFTKFRRAATWALIGWAALNLVGGGIISVHPLPILPFQPEQSSRHYGFHLLYILTQIPLLIVAAGSLRTTSASVRYPSRRVDGVVSTLRARNAIFACFVMSAWAGSARGLRIALRHSIGP